MMKRQFVWPLNVNDLEYESLEQELTCIEKTLQTDQPASHQRPEP